jgi:hypothetical protein
MTDINEMSNEVFIEQMQKLHELISDDFLEILKKYDDTEEYPQDVVFTATLATLSRITAVLVAFNVDKEFREAVMRSVMEQASGFLKAYSEVEDDAERQPSH